MADSKRNAINVLIKLLGGAEMTAELKTLGTSGETAIKKIETAAKGVSLANLGGALHNFGSDVVSTFERVAIGIGAVSAGVAAAAPFILELAKSGAEAADAAGKAAQAAGLQADAYQKLAFAAGEADVSQGQFNTAMNSFNKQITKTADETAKGAGKIGGAVGQAGRDIVQGIGSSTETFKDLGVQVTRFGDNAAKAGTNAQTGAKKITTGFDDLGIKVKNANGTLKTNEQLLLEVANAFQKLPDGARKSAISLKLFGEEGAKLIPFLNQGAVGIKALEDEAARLGIVFSDEQIKAAEQFNTALGDLKKTTAGVARQIGLIFAPAFTAAANAFKDAIARNRVAILDFVKNGVQAATVFVKDFFAVLSGRDGDVTSNKWLIDWRDAIVGFGSDFVHVATGVVIPATAKLHAAADLLTGAFNAVFGTSITTGEVLIGAALIRMVGGFRLVYSAIVVVIEAISTLSLALLANPWLLAIAAVAAGIAVWATRTDQATAALQRHEGQVDGVASAYARAGNAVKNMSDEIKNELILKNRDALKDLVPAFEAELKRLRDLAAAPAKDNPFSQALKDFAGGGSFDAYLKAVKEIGASNPKLNDAATAFLALAENAKKLQTEIKPTADFLDLLTGKITDAEFQARQAGAGFNALGANASAGLKDAGAAADETKGKVEALGQTITVFRGGASGISKEVFDVVDGVAHRADDGKQALDGLKSSVDETSNAVGGVSNEITNSIGTIAPAAQQAADGFTSALGNLDAGAAQQAAEAIVAPFSTLPGKISAILSGLQGLIQGGFTGLSSIVTSLAGQIESAISRILASLRAAAAAASALRAQAAGSSSSDSGGSHGGFAGGGSVRGPGGPKSDSIPAWLSNGEYVFTAEAVKRIGVGVLDAWNYGKDIFAGLRGFNVGGFVNDINRSLAMPRLAGGGMVSALAPAGGGSALNGASGMTHVRLDFGLGIDDVFDLVGSNLVARRLQDFAIKSSIASTGRKPKRG